MPYAGLMAYALTLLACAERVGRVQAVSHTDKHRWYYTSAMAKGEAYLWVRGNTDLVLLLSMQRCGSERTTLLAQTGYDTRPGKPCFVPHSAFKLPNAGPNPPPR